jgi:hypothetical protein
MAGSGRWLRRVDFADHHGRQLPARRVDRIQLGWRGDRGGDLVGSLDEQWRSGRLMAVSLAGMRTWRPGVDESPWSAVTTADEFRRSRRST